LTNNYPYKASNGKCKESEISDKFCGPKDVLHFPPGSYEDLINALDDGPVSVGVNASPWHMYSPSA